MSKNRTFSVVVPVYQNEANIDETVSVLLGLQDQLPEYDLELIFVNDGSTDNSYSLLLQYYERHPDKIKVVNLTRNFGQTPATREGLQRASGDCIGIISADLQEPPELFIEMIKKWEKGIKLVVAERRDREEGMIHQFISSLYWKMVNRYAVKEFPVGGFDFCLMDKQVKDEVNKIGENNTSIFPLIFWLGYSHEIIGYVRRKRNAGTSQWTFSKKLRLTIDTFINFTYVPVKFISFFGLATSLLAFLYTLFCLIKWYFWGTSVAGWASIVMLISIFGGLTLFSLGIIGEYLWRILDEARKRPNSVVDEIFERDNSP